MNVVVVGSRNGNSCSSFPGSAATAAVEVCRRLGNGKWEASGTGTARQTARRARGQSTVRRMTVRVVGVVVVVMVRGRGDAQMVHRKLKVVRGGSGGRRCRRGECLLLEDRGRADGEIGEVQQTARRAVERASREGAQQLMGLLMVVVMVIRWGGGRQGVRRRGRRLRSWLRNQQTALLGVLGSIRSAGGCLGCCQASGRRKEAHGKKVVLTCLGKDKWKISKGVWEFIVLSWYARIHPL